MTLLPSARVAAALARPDPSIRLWVIGGEGDSENGKWRDQIAASIGSDAERIDVTSSQLRDTPSILADEAAAIGLFGGPRWISVTINSGSGDELIEPAANLLAAPAAGNVVVATVAGLTKRSRLTKALENEAMAAVILTYAPEAKGGLPAVRQAANAEGLRLSDALAATISEACGHDAGIIAQEVRRLALYCDADTDNMVSATAEDWAAIAAVAHDEDVDDAINTILCGRLDALPAVLARLDMSGALGIGLIRRMAGRVQTLARLRIDIDNGRRAEELLRNPASGIHFRQHGAAIDQLRRWDGARLARAMVRLHGLERDCKAAANPADLLVRHMMLDFARVAASARR